MFCLSWPSCDTFFWSFVVLHNKYQLYHEAHLKELLTNIGFIFCSVNNNIFNREKKWWLGKHNRLRQPKAAWAMFHHAAVRWLPEELVSCCWFHVCIMRCTEIFRDVKKEKCGLLKIMWYLDNFSNFIHPHDSSTSCCQKENGKKSSAFFFPVAHNKQVKIKNKHIIKLKSLCFLLS